MFLVFVRFLGNNSGAIIIITIPAEGMEGQAALLGGGASSILPALGGLIALDCLLNNVDRVPAIWFNDGNLLAGLFGRFKCF